MTRIGLHITDFNRPGADSANVFPSVVELARAADVSGFDTVTVMDHFYQLPFIGPPENFMLECYTTLAALAQHTSKVRLGALVTGNTYRNPALLAKLVTTLDIVSGGRAQLGIGAGWYELEHDAYGYEFGTFTERFQKLEEALQIILPMLRDERPTFTGKHYSVEAAINQPAPISRIPVLIGGSGERKTLRMVAQYADEGNFTCSLVEVPRKLDALAGHCEALGRDRSTITMSKMVQVVIAPNADLAFREVQAVLATKGLTVSQPSDIDALPLDIAWGGPDEVSGWIQKVRDAGLDGVTCSMPAVIADAERVELLGRAASAVFG